MTTCIFCKIIAGDIPSQKVYEDDFIFAFKDIAPKADVHVLVIPKKHVERLDKLTEDDQALITHITLKLPEIAASQQLDTGFRTIINTGPGGGQEVYHLHYHLLGGSNLPGFH